MSLICSQKHKEKPFVLLLHVLLSCLFFPSLTFQYYGKRIANVFFQVLLNVSRLTKPNKTNYLFLSLHTLLFILFNYLFPSYHTNNFSLCLNMSLRLQFVMTSKPFNLNEGANLKNFFASRLEIKISLDFVCKFRVFSFMLQIFRVKSFII